MKNQVLIIDSDIEISKKIKYSLQDAHSETDGMELLRRLQSKNPVPVLVLSSNYSKQEECEVLRAGAYQRADVRHRLG